MPGKIRPTRKSKKAETLEIKFRERKLASINFSKIQHPKPDPGCKATLPGPPGWQYKVDPGE